MIRDLRPHHPQLLNLQYCHPQKWFRWFTCPRLPALPCMFCSHYSQKVASETLPRYPAFRVAGSTRGDFSFSHVQMTTFKMPGCVQNLLPPMAKASSSSPDLPDCLICSGESCELTHLPNLSSPKVFASSSISLFILLVFAVGAHPFILCSCISAQLL